MPELNKIDTCFYEPLSCNYKALLRQDFDAVKPAQVPIKDASFYANRGISASKRELKDTWILTLFLLLMLLFILVRRNYSAEWKFLFNAFFSNRFTGQILRENKIFKGALLLYVVSISSLLLALIAYKLWIITVPGNAWNAGLFTFFVFWLFCLFIIVLKPILSSLFFSFFRLYAETEEYVFNYFNFLLMFSASVSPFILLAVFSFNQLQRTWLMASLVCCLLFWLFGMFRFFWVATTYKHKAHYIILYICALEIMPLALMVKRIVF